MSLRTFIYLAESYKKHVLATKQNHYSEKAVSIPKPEIYMLYTGDKHHDETELSLADTFFDGDNSILDLKVKVLRGDEGDSILSQYVAYTKIYKEMQRIYGRAQAAVLNTIEKCVEGNILREFFLKRGKEAVDIMMMLFDDEINRQMLINSERAESKAEGRAEGEAIGLEKGLEKGLEVLMRRDNREVEYLNAKGDPLQINELFKEYGLID